MFFLIFSGSFSFIFSGLHLIWLGVIVSREVASERLGLDTSDSLKQFYIASVS